MATLDFTTLFRDRGAARGVDTLARSFEKAATSATDLETATKNLAKAEAKAADSLGAIRVAEARLAAVRNNAKASVTQRIAAEEGLARAQRQHVAALRDVATHADRVSGIMRKQKVAVQQVGEQVQQSSGHFKRAMGGLRAFGSAGVNATSKMAGGFKMVGGAAGIAAAGILGAIAAPVAFGLKVAAANEQAEISFTTMLGSARKAGKFLEQLKAFAAATPFEFPELQHAAASLISVGINAKNVIPIMKTLGNITSGMGTGSEGINRATLALQQMSSAGKISAEDLNQLRDAGIPTNLLFEAMAKRLGTTSKRLFEMRANGELGRKELEALLAVLASGKGFDRFNGLMDKQSKSLNGMLSTLKDTFGQGMAEALEGAIPFLKGGIGRLTKLLGRFFDYTSTHQEDMVAGFIGVGDAVLGLGEAFTEMAIQALRALSSIGSLWDNLPMVDKAALKKLGFDGSAFAAFGNSAKNAANILERDLKPKIHDAHNEWTKFGKDQRTAAALRDGNARIQQALGKTREAIKENGKTLDRHTEKGRNNRAALKNLADANRAYVDKLEKTGASTKKVDRATDNARSSFIKTAIKMGATRSQAEKLADKFGLLDRKINGLNDKRVDIKFATNAKGVYKTFKGFAVNLTSPSHVGSMATGGMVRGPGTPTSDSIPTMLSNGEFVVNAAAVKRHRQLLEAINKNQVPEMAGGGIVNVRAAKFPAGAMDVPPAANTFANAFAKATGKRLGEGLAKVFKSLDFGGPGGGITGAAGGRVHYKGGTFTKLFARNLELIQRAARVNMRIFQGGFRPRTSYSGTSHAGDAVDFQVNYRLGRAFRKYVGAAGDRTGLGHWSPHIHAVPSPSHGRAGGSAIWQYRDYVRRGGARQSMRSPWGLAAGGTLSDPSTVRMSEFGPEKVLTTAQTKSFDRLVRVMDRSGGAANTYITINAPNYVGSQDDLRRTLVDMNRRGQLEVIKTR